MKKGRRVLRFMRQIPQPARRILVCVIGGTLLLLALVGMILPIMPGVIFIPLALAVLALEFAWAARWLKKTRQAASNMHERITGKKKDQTADGGHESVE